MPADDSVRIGRLYQLFDQHFGRAGGTRVVRAPGRVNLVGDHVDYNGLSVLPMAIQRNTLMVIRAREDRTVRVTSEDDRFPPRSFTLQPHIEPSETGDWVNYVKAAVQTVMASDRNLKGFDAVVSASIPIASGLSSSSSLVVAVALGAAAVNDVEIERKELMGRLAHGERYVGTQGGGMDQAVVLGGIQGHAVRIDFDPIEVTPVQVPANWRFIIASTLVSAEKSGPAQAAYNQRVRECSDALQRMHVHLETSVRAGYPALLEDHSATDLLRESSFALDATLASRFAHVLTEARRVDQAGSIMRDADLTGFGALMNASHASLRDDYEVSCTELDELVDHARDAGAAGARMTGAGFGGCIVALCHADRVNSVLDALETRYYRFRDIDGDLADHLFIAEASAGAEVFEA